MYKTLLAVSFLFASLSFAKENVSLSKTLLKFQGEEYNMLLFPHHVVATGKKKKTRKAIKKGYSRAVSELMRQISIRGINLNLKAFTSRGSNLKQYKQEDSESYDILKDMIKMQVQIRESIFEEIADIKTETTKTTLSADDIDIDIGDDAFDISEDEVTTEDNQVISPAEAFTSGYVELSSLYNNQVLELYKALHPFNIKGKPSMKNVHSVFGISFFPTKDGRIKMMKMYIVLANINTESKQSVQIIVKDIPTYQWDRNYLYISAATGKVIRQIVSGVLGEPFLYTK